MNDVFISYARSTAAQAQRIAEALEMLGYKVWRDDALPAHRSYSDVIEERLRAAKAVLVLWSAEAVRSQWVRAEAEVAREAATLVQLRLDGATPPLPFNQVQCADMAGWNGDLTAAGWRKIVASVAELAGIAAAPRAAPSEAATSPLLAVLAFDNLSGDPEMAYFSDGVSEEVLETVARGSNLRVIARSSSFQFRGAEKAVRRVVAELKATHLLDGSVRRSGGRVRIAAQLVDCATETTLWTDRFDRDLTDVFAVQDEIATAVAEALQVAFAAPAASVTIDPAVHDLFLQAQERVDHGDVERIAQAASLLERVVTSAPSFARAWAMLAWSHAIAMRRSGERAARLGLSREAARRAAERALELDPRAGLAYQALAWLEPFASFGERERLHRKALDAAPNDPQILADMANFSSEVGRFREGLDYATRAYGLDPLQPYVAMIMSNLLDSRDEEVWAVCESAYARWPDNDGVVYNAIAFAAFTRNWARFDVLVEAQRSRIEHDLGMRDLFWFCRNLRKPYQPSIDHVFDLVRRTVLRTGTLPLQAATSLAQLGRMEEVFQLFDQASFAQVYDPAAASPSANNPGDIFSHRNTAMIGDLRFVGVCAKLGLCDYWVASDRWPDCTDEVEYDFRAEARRLAVQQPKL